MELIKQIKKAESQAKELIEQSHAEAAEMAEAGSTQHQQQMAQAQQQRKEAISKAIIEGEKRGLKQAQTLKETAEKQRLDMQNNAKKKTHTAIAQIIEHINK